MTLHPKLERLLILTLSDSVTYKELLEYNDLIDEINQKLENIEVHI